MANETKTSDWICIATSGPTADRREIDPQWLIEAAESYSRNTYAALIWPNHDTDYRHWDCNLGEVEEIKIESTEDGKKKLFARITANQFLLELNELGQKLYTSIELEPNFANTGRDYLLGLCVTDTPASLGTTRLKFSKDGEEKIIKRGSVEAFSLSFKESETKEIEAKPSFFSRIFSGRNAENNQRKPLRVFSTESEQNPAQKQEEETMNEEVKKLIETILARLDAIEAAGKGESASTPDEAAEEVATAAEEVAELAAEVIELADEIAEAPEDEILQENFSKTKSNLEDALKAYNKLTKKYKRYSHSSSRETRELRREIRSLRSEVSGSREFTKTQKPDGAPVNKNFKFY